jgi:ABC-type Mn2+/Zn2+ transport system ATPase subunit
MSGNIRNFYAGGNTAKGFYSFYDSAFAGLNRLFILKGGPGTGKSTLIRTIGENMVRRGYDIEFYHCSSDNGSLDGVIIPSLKIGIVDGTAPHVIEPKAPGAVEEYVNLGQAWDSNKLAKQRQEIEQLSSEISASFQTAYRDFRQHGAA